MEQNIRFSERLVFPDVPHTSRLSPPTFFKQWPYELGTRTPRGDMSCTFWEKEVVKQARLAQNAWFLGMPAVTQLIPDNVSAMNHLVVGSLAARGDKSKSVLAVKTRRGDGRNSQ